MTQKSVVLSAEMQAKITEAAEQVLDYVYRDPYNLHLTLVSDCLTALLQEAMQAERDRCRRACVSEMHGKTFGEVKRVQAVEKKITEGWEGE